MRVAGDIYTIVTSMIGAYVIGRALGLKLSNLYFKRKAFRLHKKRVKQFTKYMSKVST